MSKSGLNPNPALLTIEQDVKTEEEHRGAAVEVQFPADNCWFAVGLLHGSKCGVFCMVFSPFTVSQCIIGAELTKGLQPLHLNFATE